MSVEISMKGVGGVQRATMLGEAGGTYKEGMALTLKGANTVGFGVAAGSPVFGIVTKVESRDGDILLGIQTSGFNDEVLMTSTAGSRPAVGDVPYCNASGQVVKPADPASASARGVVTATDTTANTATILF